MQTNIRVIDDEIEETPSGRDAYVDRLTSRTSGTTEGTPAEEPLDGDGLPLTGYDRFCHNLTHPKRATSTSKDGR